MTAVRRRRRSRRPARKVETSAMREVLDTLGQHVEMGVVVVDGDSHYRLTAGDDGPDVMVEVELVPTGQRCSCRLASVAGGPLRGVWGVPPAGAEVVVLFPGGAADGTPIVVACLSTNELPAGVGPTTIVIAAPLGGKVVIHDGLGGEKALAYKEDVDNLADYISTELTLPVAGSVAGPVASPAPPAAGGTTVLEAK